MCGRDDLADYLTSETVHYLLDHPEEDLPFAERYFRYETDVAVPFPNVEDWIDDHYATWELADAAQGTYVNVVRDYIHKIEDGFDVSELRFGDADGALGVFTTASPVNVAKLIWLNLDAEFVNQGMGFTGSGYKDSLYGSGSRGDDVLIGGKGSDAFVFRSTDGNDSIRDFEMG